MRTETRTIYTLAELKSAHPDAYARVHARWVESCRSNPSPWGDEVEAAREAVVRECGIPANGRRDMERGEYDRDENGELKGLPWLIANVLTPKGYAPNGVPTFPGLCAWTGYCADDDMIESVHDDLRDGYKLGAALRRLDAVVERHHADDMEQQQEAETMEASWDGREYDENGNDA